MAGIQTPEGIKEAGQVLDKALEDRDVEAVRNCFAEDATIKLLGIELKGMEGVRKWLSWMFGHLDTLELIPVTIMVEGDTYFEEFVVKGKTGDGIEVRSEQSEVLVYEDYKVKELRLYFDRLDFADIVAKSFPASFIVKKLKEKSVEGIA